MSKIFDALNQKPEQIPVEGLSAFWEQLESKGKPTETSSPRVTTVPIDFRPPEALLRIEEPVTGVMPPPADLSDDCAGIQTLPIHIPLNSPLFPFNGESSQAAEQYRMARTKIVQNPRQPRMIVISSASPSDGKTLSAINIAGVLALKGEGNVLLIDADFRRSTVHERLGLTPACGLADVLEGSARLEQAIIRAEQFPRFHVLPAGQARQNPTELLSSSQWKTLSEALRKSFRFIVLDSPPIGAVADYELIQTVCDGVLLVIRPDHTARKLCFQAFQAIPQERLIGVLLNCVPKWFVRPDDYSSYYGAYKSGSR
ncbi:MAG TPA: CpsD/CapB family tyrosine-protein kinase [Terriglobia bacterium]|nr:CpsD/CapB family tyrosine-protein kinase [Terriglobia bacterium]